MENPINKPLIFISHDSRDFALATAFADLIAVTTNKYIKTFRSSDVTGVNGIQFGKSWFDAVRKNMLECSEVVCLLTPLGYERPWLLFEAGMGLMKGVKVHGLVVGMDRSAVTGPFAQDQICDLNEDRLNGLITQIISGYSPEIEPIPETIAMAIAKFIIRANELYPEISPVTPDIGLVDGIHHVNLTVRDIEVSKEFYINLFRLEDITRPSLFPFKGAWLLLPNKKQQIHLVLNPDATYRPEGPLVRNRELPPDVHFAFQVTLPTYHKIQGLLADRNIDPLIQPYKDPDKPTEIEFHQMYFLDPDNHIIELTVID